MWLLVTNEPLKSTIASLIHPSPWQHHQNKQIYMTMNLQPMATCRTICSLLASMLIHKKGPRLFFYLIQRSKWLAAEHRIPPCNHCLYCRPDTLPLSSGPANINQRLPFHNKEPSLPRLEVVSIQNHTRWCSPQSLPRLFHFVVTVNSLRPWYLLHARKSTA